MRKAVTLTVLTAASLLATASMAQQAPAPTASPTMAAIADAMGAREKMTALGVVQTVDIKNRLVSIKSEDGKIFTIKAGPEVQNLAQIGPGSVVKVVYQEALAVQLDKFKSGGINVREDTVSVGRTAPGQLPGASIEENVKMIGTILAIDTAKRTVLIQGAIHHVSLKIPAGMDLKDIKVGDQVAATYVQELGVSVGPPPTPSFNPPKVGNE